MLWIITFVCGGWAANASVKLTSPPWMATSRTSPSATMSLWLSGSLMPRSASRTSCSLAIRTNDIPDGPGGPNGNAVAQSEACSCGRHPEARAQAVEKTLRLAWNADCSPIGRPSRREASQVVRSMPSPRRGRACQGPPSLDFHPPFLLHSSGGRSRRVSPCSRSLRHGSHHSHPPRAGPAEPLLYYRGKYRRLGLPPFRSEIVTIPLARPPGDDEVKQAVLAAMDSRQWILGPQCKEFETELARYVGVRHCVLTNSATAGLWLTLRALGVKAGDEVLVPSHTAFPTIEAICFADATPVFVDADAFYTMDAADAAAKVTPRTVGVIPVHLYGQPVDLPAARELASKFGLWMLEDCAQAHGAAWQGQKVGAFGRAAVFSFYPSKNLTVMGDGGAIVTDDEEIAARCRRLRDHGRLNKDVHSEVGFNLRFNDIQAAIGRVLLRRLDAMNDRRRELAARYGTGLAGLPLELPRERPSARHVYHLYVVRTPRRARPSRDRGHAAR